MSDPASRTLFVRPRRLTRALQATSRPAVIVLAGAGSPDLGSDVVPFGVCRCRSTDLPVVEHRLCRDDHHPVIVGRADFLRGETTPFGKIGAQILAKLSTFHLVAVVGHLFVKCLMLLGDDLAQLLLLILRQLSLLLLELSFNRAEPVSQILAHRLEPNTFGRVLLSKCDPIDIAERLCLRHCQRQHLLKALQILLSSGPQPPGVRRRKNGGLRRPPGCVG